MADDPPGTDPAPAAVVIEEASPFATLEPQTNGVPAALPDDGAAAFGATTGRLDLVLDVPVCLSVEKAYLVRRARMMTVRAGFNAQRAS